MRCELRGLQDEDLAVLFEQWADPVAMHMAAFTAPDHMDRRAFERRLSRLRADETVIAKVIVVDEEITGTIGSWGGPDAREVTNWIGRSFWGKGIATSAFPSGRFAAYGRTAVLANAGLGVVRHVRVSAVQFARPIVVPIVTRRWSWRPSSLVL